MLFLHSNIISIQITLKIESSFCYIRIHLIDFCITINDYHPYIHWQILVSRSFHSVTKLSFKSIDEVIGENTIIMFHKCVLLHACKHLLYYYFSFSYDRLFRFKNKLISANVGRLFSSRFQHSSNNSQISFSQKSGWHRSSWKWNVKGC